MSSHGAVDSRGKAIGTGLAVSADKQPPSILTCEVIVFLTLVVRQRHKLLEEQGVLEHSLNRLDEVRLQRGGMLLGGIPGIQESLEGFISFSCKQGIKGP